MHDGLVSPLITIKQNDDYHYNVTGLTDVDYPVADVEMLALECWAVCLETSAGNQTLLFIYPAL